MPIGIVIGAGALAFIRELPGLVATSVVTGACVVRLGSGSDDACAVTSKLPHVQLNAFLHKVVAMH